MNQINNFRVENSSNKTEKHATGSDMSPGMRFLYQHQKDSAFMRAMLHDDNTNNSPDIEQVQVQHLQSIGNTELSSKAFNNRQENKDKMFCEGFSVKLRELIDISTQMNDVNMSKEESGAISKELQENLEDMLSSFEMEAERVRQQCIHL
jgi:hypothetical protein